MSKPTRPRRPLIEAIEPRLLFSATADIAVFDDGSHYVDALTHAANNLDLTQAYPDLMAQPQAPASAPDTISVVLANDTPVALPNDIPVSPAVHSLVFVDTHVANYQTLVQDILNNPANNNVEIIYLDANKDGMAQISQTLDLFSNISSIHLISHGVAGELQLGNSVLNENNIAQFKNQLHGWQSALTSDADILIYGCDLAANNSGVHLLEQLNQLTGADIAASTNLTGNAAHADWVLEKNIGHIETQTLINPQQQLAWSGVLADVTYINTGSGGSNYALVPGDFAGQSFQYTSSVTIDRFSVEINKTAGAAAQNLTLEIRDGYNGAVIGSATVSSSSLSNGVQWVNFDFPETTLNAYQIYWARLSTSGSDHLIAATYHNTDVYSTGTFFNNAGGNSWDLSFAVTNVDGTNTAPTVNITPTTYSATEQVVMNLHGTGISVADMDGDVLSVTIAAAVNNSQITANVGTTGVSITSGNGTKTLVLSGTPTQLNDFFNGGNSATLTYRMAADTPVASTNLTITANDGVVSASDSATINITAVNDAPVNSVPGPQNINEDTALVFSAGNGNPISIADVDAGSSPVRTTLSVSHGVLSLAGVSGLTFTSGNGTSNASMTFTGTITDINAALAALTYSPATNYNGTDTLTITTNDLGNTGTGGALSDTDTVTINLAPINDAPTVAHPIPDQNAPKNTAFNFAFGSNTFADVDGDTLTYSAQLSGGGSLPAWLGFNAATRTFSGTPSNSDVGTINVEVTASDGNGGSIADTFAIITSAEPDTDFINTGSNNFELTVSNAQTVGQSFSYNSGNGTYVANEVSLFTVAYGGAPQTVTVQLLDAWNGNILGSASAASTDLARDSKEWYTFNLGDITLADNTTYYIKVSSTGSDNAIKLGHFGDVTGGNVVINGADDNSKDLAFKLTYDNGNNVAPALDNPIADKAINTDAAFNFTVPANTFSDADPLDTLSYRAHLVGRSDLDWITFNTATLEFGGTPHASQIGTWQVELIATDNHGASTSEFFDVVVSNANTVPTPIPDQVVLEGSAYNFQFTAFNNANGDTLTYTATQSNGNPLPSWFNFAPSTRTFYGMADDGDVGVREIKVTATDPYGASVSDTFVLTVNNLQEAPFILNPIADQTATGHVPFTFSFNDNVAADPDIGDSLTYSVQLAGGGVLPSWLSYDANTRTFSGTPTNADAGMLSIDVIATDTGNNTVTDTFDIVISTGNTPPVNTVPGAQTTNEDTALVFSAGNSNAIQISDADAGSGNLQVTLGVSHGTLTLASTAGLSFTTGDGSDDANIVFTGTLADINTALATLTYMPAANYQGTDTLGITTNDQGNTGIGGAHSDTDTIAISIAPVNDAPTVANPIPDQTTNSNSAFNFQVAANAFNDVDLSDALTYSANLNGGGVLPAWLSFNATTRTFSGTPTNSEVGTLNIVVTANDGHGGIVSDNFNLTINLNNQAPTVTAPIVDQTTYEDSLFTFTVPANTFNDTTPGDSLSYSATLNNGNALPAWLHFNNTTQTFSGTPTNDDVGNLSITITATDNFGASVSNTFALSILNTNDAPVLNNAIANQFARENNLFSFTIPTNTFKDIDKNDTLVFSAQLANNNPLPDWLVFDANTQIFSGTPTNDDVGNLSITITATDNFGASVSNTFALSILNTNDAPALNNAIANQFARENNLFSFTIPTNTFKDIDKNDTLIFSAQLANNSPLPDWLVFDANTQTFSGTPTNDDVGNLSITITATDNFGASVSNTFALSILNTNDAPVLNNAIANQFARENNPFSFTIPTNTFKDIDKNDTLVFSAQLANNNPLPDWLVFDANTQTFSGTPTNDDVGNLSITITATDNFGASVSNTFALSILNTNDAPVLNNAIANQFARENNPFSFTIPTNTFKDIDKNDTLVFSAQLANNNPLPDWLVFDANTQTFSGTPTNDDVGNLSITITATDNFGASVSNTFALSILNTNDAPVLNNAIANQFARENNLFSFTIPTNTFKDIDKNDTLVFSAQLANNNPLPDWLVFDANTQTFSGTPHESDMGSLNIQVVATDSQGATASANFVLEVTNVNQAPTTSGIATLNTVQNSAGDSVDLFAAFADREDRDEQLTYTIINNTNNTLVTQTNIDMHTGKLQLHYGEDQFGSSQITVRATDSEGLSVDTSFTVNVAFVNHAPTSTGISDIQVNQGSLPSTIDLSAIFNDAEDGKNLHYSLVNNTNPALLQSVQFNQSAHSASILYNATTSGETTLTLRAIDSNGDFVDSQFKITVIAQNPTTPTDNNGNNSNPINTNPTNPNPIGSNTNSNSGNNLTDTNKDPGNHSNSGNTNTGHNDSNNSTTIIGGGGGVIKNPDNTDNKNPTANDHGLSDNLIGHAVAGETPAPTVPAQSHEPVAENFDHNRYDRIVQQQQQEATAKKSVDLVNNHALVSSLILPGEGFSYSDAQEFSAQLRKIHQEMDNAIAEEQHQKAILSGITLSLTTGILIWSLRASSLLLTLMSMLPLWRGIDPLPILEEVEKRKKDIEQQRKDKQAEDKSSKEVGYLFDNTNVQPPKE